MIVYGEVEAKRQAFLIPSFNGSDLSSSHPGRFVAEEVSPGAPWVGWAIPEPA
jgi:hypothetical protein